MSRVPAAFLAALLAGAVLVPQAAAAPRPAAPSPESPLQVVVTDLLPRAPAPGDVVQVVGYVRNVGTETIRDVHVQLKVGDRITTRGGLHDADVDRPFTSVRPRSGVATFDDSVAPGRTTKFDIRTTVTHLGLRGLGVYPLDVEALGDGGDGLESLGLAPTWIPFFGDARPRQTRVAVLWPLVDQPRQAVDSTLLDDSLAAALTPGGRLGRLLAAAKAAALPNCGPAAHGPDGSVTAAPTRCEPVHVTYAVDPDLLFVASTMRSPYKVRRGEKSVAGKGRTAAAAWLSSLRTAARGSDIVALPYADPDVTALTREAGNREDVALAQALGRGILSSTLSATPVDVLAWPPSGVLTQEAVDVLARGGARSFVLDQDAYEDPEDEPFPTPAARAVLTTSATGAQIDALVADEALSDLLAGTGDVTHGPRIAEQRFLAETAIISAERPGVSRTLVLAPPRRGDVSVAAAAGALRDLGRVPWLCPVSLTTVASEQEHCADHRDSPPRKAGDRGELRTDREGELSQSYLEQVAADRDQVTQLTDSVLSDRQAPAVRDAVATMKARLRQAVARAQSSAWRTDAAGGRRTSALLHREVQRLVGKVVVRGGRALLTSTEGTLQVSLENTLDVPVSVKVRFSSKTANLSTAETALVEVPPGHAVPASVKAEAQRSGQFVVFAQIVDRSGKPFGPETEVIVRSTRYGRVALALTAAGAGVLLVAAGVRVARRASRKRT